MKVYIKAMVLALASLGVSSCMNDLAKGNIDPNATGEADLTALYSKCYAGLIMEGNDGDADFTIDDAGKSTLVRNIFNFNVLSTDESICWWSDGGIVEIGYNQCQAGTATLKFLYYRLYNNIAFCNHYLSLEAAKEDPTTYAEVRFLRALNYAYCLDFFGDPSFVPSLTAENPQQAHYYNEAFDASKSYTRAELLALGREFMFNWLVEELTDLEGDLLDATAKTDTDADYGRADKAAAWFLLSRLYLNAGTYLNNDGQDNPYWAEAKAYADKVINSSYKLFTADDMSATQLATGYKAYDLLFMGDNGSSGASCEAVLPLLQDGKTTKGYGGSLFFLASLWNANMATVTGQDAATTGNTWAGMRCRPDYVEKYTSNPDQFVGMTAQEIRALGVDDRCIIWGAGDSNGERTLSLGTNSSFYEGLTVPKWHNNYSTGADPHDSYDVDIDFFLFRVAEMYLNAAEAALQLGNASEAKTYIDAIRSRANATIQTSYDLDFILDERSRELYAEGTRRTDLIRFNQYGGTQATYNWSYKGGNINGVTFDAYRNVYPLPADEISANSNLTQIYGYNE